MNQNSKNIGLAIVGYFLIFSTAILTINQFILPGLFYPENFLSFDSNHYLWIAEKGYGSNKVAFFPLFPKLWAALNLGVYGIVAVNVLLFLASFLWLSQKFQFKFSEVLIFLSIPSFCFFYLPYSEALFFATSTILLIGMKEKNRTLVLMGLFLSVLTRSAFVVLVPALIIVETLTEKLDKNLIINILTYLLLAFISLITVALIQYYDTSRWFEFFSIQKEWNNQLQMINLPLTSWGGDTILKLDAVALLIGIISGVILFIKIIYRFWYKHLYSSKELILSLGYLGGMTLYILLFRGGSIHSLNRYIFAVPYLVIAMHYFFKSGFVFGKKEFIITLLGINLFWLLFGSFSHIQVLLGFLVLSIYIILFPLIKSKNRLFSNVISFLIIGINLFLQIYFFIHFLQSEWVG